VDDDGTRLRTFSVVPPEFRRLWSVRYQQDGLIAADQEIYSVAKYHFYRQPFSVLELHGTDVSLLGYYCDIVTPLQKTGDDYALLDLFLDMWVWPDQRYRELDWDEYRQAVADGLVSADLQALAETTMQRLREEIAAGVFPRQYIA
jgi:uncharacterized protein